MKYTALICLLGSSQAFKLGTGSNQEKLYDAMNLQTDKVLELLPNWDGWHPHMEEFPGTVNEFGNYMQPYKRVMPQGEVFVGNAADEGYYPVDGFTQNMLTKYAVEGVTDPKLKNPQPTGSFYLTKAAARNASLEVLCTHFSKCGAEAEKYLNFENKYDEAWAYYDVNSTGRIDAIGVSQFFRYLVKPLGSLDI